MKYRVENNDFLQLNQPVSPINTHYFFREEIMSNDFEPIIIAFCCNF